MTKFTKETIAIILGILFLMSSFTMWINYKANYSRTNFEKGVNVHHTEMERLIKKYLGGSDECN